MNSGSGLTIKNGTDLNSFAISYDGEYFVWAKFESINDKVEVWNENIKNSTVVRYAWDNNPFDVNLFTKEGLPSTPFEVKKK